MYILQGAIILNKTLPSNQTLIVKQQQRTFHWIIDQDKINKFSFSHPVWMSKYRCTEIFIKFCWHRRILFLHYPDQNWKDLCVHTFSVKLFGNMSKILSQVAKYRIHRIQNCWCFFIIVRLWSYMYPNKFSSQQQTKKKNIFFYAP